MQNITLYGWMRSSYIILISQCTQCDLHKVVVHLVGLPAWNLRLRRQAGGAETAGAAGVLAATVIATRPTGRVIDSSAAGIARLRFDGRNRAQQRSNCSGVLRPVAAALAIVVLVRCEEFSQPGVIRLPLCPLEPPALMREAVSACTVLQVTKATFDHSHGWPFIYPTHGILWEGMKGLLLVG